MEITSESTQETEELAQQLARQTKPGDVLALYGELGSGKTTFTGFYVKALGFESRVQSPTFIIIRRYKKDNGGIKVVYHADLYRLTKREELEDLGLDEMFEDEEAVTIIEWPELLEEILPENARKIKFSYIDENVRSINVQDQDRRN